MSPAARRAALGVVLAALALGACGPYAKLAQKLDVNAQIVGVTWVAAAGADRQQTRILLVGELDAHRAAPFAATSIVLVPYPDGTVATVVTTRQGTWVEAASGDTSLNVNYTWTLPDESQKSPTSRRGTDYETPDYTLQAHVTRGAGQLVVTGDANVAGTYVRLDQALGHLGTTTARDASCAFQMLNLPVVTSDGRIVGFGGPGMLQYQHSEDFVGTVAGTVNVRMSGSLTGSTTYISYYGFMDQGGIRIDGQQVTHINDYAGNGSMSGVLSFQLMPAFDVSTATTITGTVDYGSADPVQIHNGNAAGGSYLTHIDGGVTASVPVTGLPNPSVADCLQLP